MAVDFTVGKNGAFNIDEGLAFVDEFEDVRHIGQSPGRLDLPQITAVGLRFRSGNVKQELARIAQIRIGIDGFAAGGTRQVVDGKIQDRLRAVRA